MSEPEQPFTEQELADIESGKFEVPDFSEDELAIADRALDAAARGEFDDVDYAKVNAPVEDDEEEDEEEKETEDDA